MDSKDDMEKEWRTSLPYALCHFSTSGGAVAVATAFTHPLDVVKVRLQMQLLGQRGPLVGMGETFGRIIKVEGVRGLYVGLVPALTRSTLYGGLRLGLYQPCKYLSDLMVGSTNIFVKIASGAFSGALATALTNPMEVLKVRLQMNSRRGLTGEIHKIISEEGFRALWKGVGPAMTRAGALTASQLVTYDESKQALLKWTHLEEGFHLHLMYRAFFHYLFRLLKRNQLGDTNSYLCYVKLKFCSRNCWNPCNCTCGHDQDTTNVAARFQRPQELQKCISLRIPGSSHRGCRCALQRGFYHICKNRSPNYHYVSSM